MGIDSNTPSLFDQFPEKSGVSEPVLRPSEEFQRAHPDEEQLVSAKPEWDPNARRSKQLEGVGGGLRAAVDGELQQQVTTVSVDKVTPVTVTRSQRRNYEPRSGDSERGFGKPDYYAEPHIPSDNEKQIGRAAIARIREQMAQRKSAQQLEKES